MDITAMMTPMPSDSEESYAKEMGSHTEMMCEVLKSIGKLEAKLDMLLEDEKEDEAEDSGKATDGILALPMGSQSSTGGTGITLPITYDGLGS